MVTSVEFSDDELKKLQDYTHCADPAAAIKAAAAEYVRYRQRLDLIELSGKVEMVDNWRELEQAELDDNPYGVEAGDR
jgi:hypothetical protein